MWYKVKHIYCWTNLVRPSVPATAITLNKSSISLTTVGQTSQLTATLTPSWSTSTVSWSSSNTSIATVSSSWLVTCVTPWSCTITATTNNWLTATCWVTKSRLPSAYQEVEYIQSSWTQCIDTGYIPSNNTKIEMSMWWFNSSTNANALFGARYSWNATASIGRWFQRSVNAAVSPYWYWWMFGRNYSSWTDNFNVFSWWDWWNHILSLDQSWFYQDGVKKYTPYTVTFTSPVNLYIFSNNTNWQISEFAPYKLYYFKIYNSWTLVRDFVPCYRKSDNVIWLYDLVNNQFYTNQWSWTFNKWWNVN